MARRTGMPIGSADFAMVMACPYLVREDAAGMRDSTIIIASAPYFVKESGVFTYYQPPAVGKNHSGSSEVMRAPITD